MDESVVGKTARVTGKVTANSVGEVMVSVRQGTEAYLAYPYDKSETFEKGTQVTILEESGRAVWVA